MKWKYIWAWRYLFYDVMYWGAFVFAILTTVYNFYEWKHRHDNNVNCTRQHSYFDVKEGQCEAVFRAKGIRGRLIVPAKACGVLSVACVGRGDGWCFEHAVGEDVSYPGIYNDQSRDLFND